MDVIDTPQALTRLREAKGLSLDAAHQHLRLHIKQIQALEAGRWDELPGAAFVRASLRSYAKWLEADASALISSLGAANAGADLRPATSLDQPIRGQGSLGFGNGGKGHLWAWLLLIIVGLVTLAVAFAPPGSDRSASSWIKSSEAPSSSAAGANTPTKESPPGPPAVEATPGTTVTSVPLDLPPPGVPGVEASSTGVASTTAAPAAAPAPTTPPAAQPVVGGQRKLELTFDTDSWVDIKQADGKVLLYGLQKSGTSASAIGEGELRFVIGNAARVKLEVDGKPISLSAAPGSGIGRLTLAP
jgi:cytoskeleton protein RodZ